MIESERRLKDLRGEEVLGLNHDLLRWLQGLKKLFPEVPDEILVQIPPRKNGKKVPWNRRWRKKISSSPDLVLRLFSGGNPRFWQEGLAPHGLTALLCWQVHTPWSWSVSRSNFPLLGRCLWKWKGRIIFGWTALPHCQQVEVPLSLVRPLSGLDQALKDLDFEIFLLVFEYVLSKILFCGFAIRWPRIPRDSKVGSLSESPEDPERHKKEDDPNEYPSFYSWPEWKSIRERLWPVWGELWSGSFWPWSLQAEQDLEQTLVFCENYKMFKVLDVVHMKRSPPLIRELKGQGGGQHGPPSSRTGFWKPLLLSSRSLSCLRWTGWWRSWTTWVSVHGGCIAIEVQNFRVRRSENGPKRGRSFEPSPLCLKSNGRADAEIGLLKRATNTIMRASNVDTMFLASCSSTCGRTPWSSSAKGMRTGTFASIWAGGGSQHQEMGKLSESLTGEEKEGLDSRSWC